MKLNKDNGNGECKVFYNLIVDTPRICSTGSSSMASACAGSLALMDAGKDTGQPIHFYLNTCMQCVELLHYTNYCNIDTIFTRSN